jgi:hypothetical protein
MMVHFCNPSTPEAEAGEWGVPRLHSKTLSQKTNDYSVRVLT